MRVKATSENKRFEYQSEIFIKYLDVKWRVVNGEIEKPIIVFFTKHNCFHQRKVWSYHIRLPNGDVCCHTSLPLDSAYEKALSLISRNN